MQVIWAIGASMVVLAGAQFLGSRTCFALGACIVLGHNLLDPVWPVASTTGTTGPAWVVLHARQVHEVGPFWVYFSYPLLPWIGVMLAGYGSAGLFEGSPKLRDTRLMRVGIALTVAFVLLRALNIYGDPRSWHADSGSVASSVMAFLATTKYPPSLLYILMTLGPAAIVCALADRIPGRVRQILLTFGRAPFAFYVAHLYLIHVVAILIGVAQGFGAQQFLAPYRFFPKGFGVSLIGVYLVWIAVVIALYPLCRWVTAVKARRRDWWLSYL